MKHIVLILIILCVVMPSECQTVESGQYENVSAFPLLGNWTGNWINPQIGYEKIVPDLAAQVNVVDINHYYVEFVSQLHKRAAPYLSVEIMGSKDKIEYHKSGWNFIFRNDSCIGDFMLNGGKVSFELRKIRIVSPTLGLNAPEGAVVLFDGSNLKQWQHSDNRDVTWKIIPPGVMETVSSFWHAGQNKKNGLGGDIVTKQKFGNLKFHMEFRYPVEAGKSGQGRGNSGLFFFGIGEIQILNSFALPGYWDDCGAIYHRFPPMVNAAAPPLQWQSYDVDLVLPKFDKITGKKFSEAILTVRLNGILIHNKLEIETDTKKVDIGLQDHINRIQYRNIWVKES